jgi:hypothetical protein
VSAKVAAAVTPKPPARAAASGIRFRGPTRDCVIPTAETALLHRELLRVSVDGRDAAASAARRIDVALSRDALEVGPMPEREAAAIRLALLRLAPRDAGRAHRGALLELLALEYPEPDAD